MNAAESPANDKAGGGRPSRRSLFFGYLFLDIQRLVIWLYYDRYSWIGQPKTKTRTSNLGPFAIVIRFLSQNKNPKLLEVKYSIRSTGAYGQGFHQNDAPGVE